MNKPLKTTTQSTVSKDPKVLRKLQKVKVLKSTKSMIRATGGAWVYEKGLHYTG